MKAAIVLLSSVLISDVLTELCVLQELVTINKPVCKQMKCNNTALPKTKSFDDRPDLNLPLVPLGSPSSGHLISLDSNENDGFTISKETSSEESTTKCKNDKYRSIDGSCNNLDNPEWGKSKTPYIRMLFPRYTDFPVGGISFSVTGKALPLPRVISTTLFPDRDRPWTNYTLATMQWGQLVAHDSSLSSKSSTENIDCCVIGESRYCCPIEIPKNDPFYSKFNSTCINMIRTKCVEQTAYNCKSIINQYSAETHYFDVSFVYGPTKSVMSSVRKYSDGELLTSTFNDREFPVLSTDPNVDCNSRDPNIICFHSGDKRVNQNSQVTCLTTVMLREHNRIARALKKLNPKWTDEQLFQEARSIVIAEYQHITYNEWLPTILGDTYMEKYNLKPLKEGYTKYNDKVDATTMNCFATGAFRIFHSQIQGALKMYSPTKCPNNKQKTEEGRCPFRSIDISDYMNLPEIVTQNSNYDALLLGLVTELSQSIDRFFTSQMTTMMFHDKQPYGEDLESFDIQRGRDHGLASYNSYREVCNLKVAKNFSDLSGEISEKKIAMLQSIYADVNDIDLFVGSILENLVEGSTVGPTALCISGEEFVRKKIGDRFWYEVGDQSHSFKEAQLQEIRKSTLSRLLCDNSDNITTIQPQSFLTPSVAGNAIVNCDSLPSVNLSKWET